MKVSRGMLMALLVLGITLAGCIEASDEVARSEDTEDASDGDTLTLNKVEADKASLIGQVVSDALEPLQGATVVVQELELNTTTNREGRFKFEGLEPGRYSVFAQLDGHKVQRNQVELVAGRGIDTNFILDRLPTAEPHVLVVEQAGFLECQTGALVVTMNCVPIQNVLNDLEMNPTNTKQILKWEFAPDGLEAVVAEMVWDPPLEGTAGELRLLVEQDSTDLIEGGQYADEMGPSPVRVEMTEWENLPKSEDNETNGVFQTRVFPPGFPGTLVFQQKYTIFMSYFYYQLPTPGYTGIPEGFTA